MPAQTLPRDPATATRDLVLPARDGFTLAATLYGAEDASRFAIVSSAMAVPRGFYRAYARGLAARGFGVLTYDYRGTGGSRPASLRGFEALARDYALLDLQGMLDWACRTPRERLVLVGHSVGGQLAGLLEDPSGVSAMLTYSAQSGHWRLQGGLQPPLVFFHTHVTLPVLSRVWGYMPWSVIGAGEDLPQGVALEWSRWCRHPDYLLGDDTLPLERYAAFPAPVLAVSIDDDTWGTKRAVDAMMRAYPDVRRRHLRVADTGLSRIGHFGIFRRRAAALWEEGFDFLEGTGEA